MRDSILRILEEGRIRIPNDLLELAYIIGKKNALCKGEDGNSLKICSMNNLKDQKVLALIELDDEDSFIYPKELVEEEYEQIFEIYYLNGYIYIEEVEIK